MIKKCFIIVLLVFLIVAQMGLCFADDYNNYVISVSTSNPNVSNIVTRDYFDYSPVEALKEQGYKSIFSRYATTSTRITISNIYISLEFVYSTNVHGYTAFRQYILSGDFFNVSYTDNVSNVVNNLNINKETYSYSSNQMSAYFLITGSISFDLFMNNSGLVDGVDVNEYDFPVGGFKINLPNSYFDLADENYKLVSIYDHGVGKYNYTLSYSFDRILTSVQGFMFASKSDIKITSSNSQSYIISQPGYTFNYQCNNSIQSQTLNKNYLSPYYGYVLDNICYRFTMTDKSQIKSISYSAAKTSNQLGTSVPYYSGGYFGMEYEFMVNSPLFYNNLDNFIQSSANETNTPLHIDYYDCEWYEIHYQLANAFIFLITELPIVSDVTNLIYTLVDIINNSLGTLLNFNGFGIIFAFGMFAVILGIFLKFIMGSD